jgi:hypothetical protein
MFHERPGRPDSPTKLYALKSLPKLQYQWLHPLFGNQVIHACGRNPQEQIPKSLVVGSQTLEQQSPQTVLLINEGSWPIALLLHLTNTQNKVHAGLLPGPDNLTGIGPVEGSVHVPMHPGPKGMIHTTIPHACTLSPIINPTPHDHKEVARKVVQVDTVTHNRGGKL